MTAGTNLGEAMSEYWGFRFLIVLISLVGSLSVGCSTIGFVRLDPSLPVELAEDEGFLILQIDTDVPLGELTLWTLRVDQPFSVGKHSWITKARAGHYSWYSVEVAHSGRKSGMYRLRRNSYSRPDELDFDIIPGRINYAGELIIRGVEFSGRWISVRNRNHSAMAIRELRKNYPELLDAYPLHYAGTSDDGFIEFYSAERDRKEQERVESSIEVDSQ